MRYRLKDRAMQEKLDDITAGGFSKVLEKKIDVTFFCEEFLFLGAGSIRVRLFESAFEEVPEYDPNAWNEWPDMEPPEHVLMQVEFKEKDKERLYRSCWKWSGYEWNWGDGRGFVSVNTDNLREIRFRPWGDS